MGTTAEALDARFGALANRTRRAIVARLAKGEATVTELARPFSMSQPAITKHLSVLERAGLISRGRDAQRRPCRLRPEAVKDVADWVDGYRHFWDESFDRLDEYLDELKRKETRDGSEH
ncbi:MAG: metalloregulator ArsR/SmtB family transcription factor [Actinomycetota bacterium]|nr:metalloregulator ArsR/SmtB family transcription factor [Actinomycetota bacterium]